MMKHDETWIQSSSLEMCKKGDLMGGLMKNQELRWRLIMTYIESRERRGKQSSWNL